jgi:simple sugar transport system substrate-binding protein
LTRLAALAVSVLLVASACQAAVPSNAPAASGAGASGPAATGAPQGKQLTFYFVGIAGADDPFWAIIIKGATDAGKHIGVSVKYVSPAKFNLPEMVTLTDQAISAHADGIATSMADPAAQTEPGKRAAAAGIPIVADGNPPAEKAADDPFLFWNGSDDFLGGQRGATRMLQAGKPKGVVCGINEPGNIPVEARCNGSAEVFTAAGVKAEKLATGQDRTQAAVILKGYLTSHPDVDAYFGGSQPLFGLLAEATANGPMSVDLGGTKRTLRVATFDLDPPVLDGIKKDQVEFTIDQQTYMRGYMPIIMLGLYARYGIRPVRDGLTGPAFIDKSNVDAVIDLAKQGYR